MQSNNVLRRLALVTAAALATACSATDPTAAAAPKQLGESMDPSAAIGDVQVSSIPYEWVSFCYKSISSLPVASVQMNVDYGNNGTVDLTQSGTIARGTCRHAYLHGGADDAVSFTLLTVPPGESLFGWTQNTAGSLASTPLHVATSTSNVLVGGTSGAVVMLRID